MVLGILIVPAIAFGILAFYFTQVPVHPLGGPLFDWLYGALSDSYLLLITGVFVNLTGAFLVNLLYNAHNYAERENYFPALIYFLIASSQLSWEFLNPVIVGNVFVLLALRRILRMYRVQEITSMIYDAGLFLSLGALFFPLLILAFPLLWFSLIQLRTFNLREWIVPFMGVSTPAIFAAVVFWWYDYTLDYSEFTTFSDQPFREIFTFHGALYYPLLIISVFIFLAGLLTFLNDMTTSTVHKKNTKKVYVTTSIFLLGIYIYGIALSEIQAGMLAVLAPPLAVFAGVYFSRSRRKKLRQALFYIWILLLIVYPILESMR